MLKIALVGAPDSGQSQLAASLSDALKASGRDAAIALIDSAVLEPDLTNHDLTLLMGLDTSSKTARLTQEAADQFIRAALDRAGIAYRVIYGQGEERLQNAIHACESLFEQEMQAARGNRVSTEMVELENGNKIGQWVRMCDKCSDPLCEHQLLTALLSRRARPA